MCLSMQSHARARFARGCMHELKIQRCMHVPTSAAAMHGAKGFTKTAHERVRAPLTCITPIGFTWRKHMGTTDSCGWQQWQDEAPRMNKHHEGSVCATSSRHRGELLSKVKLPNAEDHRVLRHHGLLRAARKGQDCTRTDESAAVRGVGRNNKQAAGRGVSKARAAEQKTAPLAC